MNWEIGIDMYTLMRIKQIANKNLLYKKIKKKRKRKQEEKKKKWKFGHTKRNLGCIHRRKTMRRGSKWAAVCKPRRETSEGACQHHDLGLLASRTVRRLNSVV